MIDAIQHIRAQVLAAAGENRAMRIQGGSTRSFYGNSVEGVPLDMRPVSGIVSYDPTELVVVARAGTLLSELDAALAEKQQALVFEPPCFGPQGTVGGMVATGLSGPRRLQVGGVRDFILGATLMGHDGELRRFGGTVMKNVAGYDVARMVAGSMGFLGPIVEVALKVMPKPMAERTLRFECHEHQMAVWVQRQIGRAYPIAATAWIPQYLHHETHGAGAHPVGDDGLNHPESPMGVLYLRLSGAQSAIDAASRDLGGERLNPEHAKNFWKSIQHQTHPFFEPKIDAKALWRVAVPPLAAPLHLAGHALIEWGGAQRWVYTEEAPERVRAQAVQRGGHAVLYRAPAEMKREFGVFAPLAPTIQGVHERLKAAFDPHGLFNRGALFQPL